MHLYNSINMYKDSFYCNEIAFLLIPLSYNVLLISFCSQYPILPCVIATQVSKGIAGFFSSFIASCCKSKFPT